MKIRTKILLSAAAAVAAGTTARPSAAEDTLIVSPIEGPSSILPPEPGNLDPLPGSDAWIAAQVTQTFLSNRSAVAADAEVDVKDGVVHLRGQTVSEEYKALATAYAREVEGVKSVDNRMAVVGTRVSVKSTTLDKMNDAAVTARVKAALLFHSPCAFRTKVRTKDGVVALRGRARSETEKDMIGKLVTELDGVSGVDNRMTLAR